MAICPTCHAHWPDGEAACPVDGTPLGPAALLGRVLGERYRILRQIGAGGMGTVYLCEHVVLRKRMAVKVLRPEYSADDELVRRFQQEAMAASLIGQENIVDVIDFGRTAEGSLYFVMEAIDGESLAAVLRREGALPLARTVPVLAQLCRALAAAHARGIVHRDLKPDNVLLVPRDGGAPLVKVLDFGISKVGNAPETPRITRAGMIIGTPEYMAPEQAEGASVDHRADVYAFGVLAYEMSTGQLPFRGASALATLIQHKTEAPVAPSRRRPELELPPELDRLVLRALEKSPDARQQSMGEVAAELLPLCVSLGLPAPAAVPAPRRETPLPADAESMLAEGAFPTPARMTLRHETLALDGADLPSELPRPSPLTCAPPDGASALGAAGAGSAVEVGGAALVDHLRAGRGAAAAGGSWEVSISTAAGGVAAHPRPRASARRRRLAVALAVAACAVAGLAAGLLRSRPGAAPLSTAAAMEAPRPADPTPTAPLRVVLRSEPPGAEVFAGSERLGVTPMEVELPPGGRAEYRFERAGFRPRSLRVGAEEGVVEVRLARAGPRRELGERPRKVEYPYRKLDDLKPDPFD